LASIVASIRSGELSPWIVLPSIQRVASLWLSHSRSTRFPAHSFGTVALTRNQYVAQSGPNCSPTLAGRHSFSCCAAAYGMRSTRWETSSSSTGLLMS